MASTTRKQPPWNAPKAAPGVQIPPLRIYNSLTRQKEAFVPQDPAGKKVTWYACGPTVYDDAHLGHARNYVSTDVLRRILAHYFKFDVQFVMNITDVDDKIILRGRQQHLLAKFVAEHTELDATVTSEARKAFDAYIQKNLSLVQDVVPENYEAESKRAYKAVLDGKALEGDGPPTDKEAKIKMHLRTALSASSALSQATENMSSISLGEFLAKTEDVFLPYLDLLYGSSIDASNHSVFTKLTKKYEQRFFEDMDALNNLRPDLIVRVTEFGPQIVKFVEQIVKNGFAYSTSDGSVYFDIAAFEKGGNPYARLEPWNRGDKDLQADGEGALTKKSSEKRSEADFALWKSSKPGEPAWPSPWGPGRPGWHIECSVMASEALGKVMDIHSGGIDLAFPHHDNELAQSEAYWLSEDDHDCAAHGGHEWVKYFVHMGHLSIQGSKMSKSLKNFTTVREALSRGDWTPRGLRIVFLLGGWKDGVEITDDLVKQGQSFEDKVTNFFLKAIDIERHRIGAVAGSASEEKNDSVLLEKFSQAQKDLDIALCDSFNTPAALRIISDLITDFNSIPTATLTDESVLTIARWVTRILTIFGLDGESNLNDQTRIGWTGVKIPAPAQQLIYPLSAFRDEVRNQARSKEIAYATIAKLATESRPAEIQDANAIQYAEVFSQFQDDVKALVEKEAPAKDLLALCDKLRDIQLWDLGIYLEDRDGLPALVRPVDRTLLTQRAEKENLAQAKVLAKAKREAEELEKKKAAEEKAKVKPDEMFKTEEFGEWDADGLPTKMKDGEEVSKAKGKKLKKEWEKQKKVHEEWLKGQGSSA